jgi:cell division protease FtsH
MKFSKYLKSFKSSPRNVLVIIFLLVASITLLTRLTDYSRATKQLGYSEFLTLIESDQVQKVHIVNKTEAHGRLKDGKYFEAAIADSPTNFDLLRLHKVEFSVDETPIQLSIWHLLFGFLLLGSVGFILFFIRQNRSSSGSSNLFSMGKSRAKMFMPSQIKVNFSNVAGAHEAKDALQDIVDYLKNPEKYRRIGARLTRGVLLVGEPGNGKTLLAKAIAGEAQCPFLSVSGSDFIEVFVGVGAARIRDLFAQARKHAPCIIFIDEIDAIGRQRGSGMGGGHDEREQTLNQLLIEMDGFESSGSPIVILAATNMPDVLDKALLRPGRFDRRVDVPFPDTESREEILKIHTKTVKLSDEVNLHELARDTAGFSGSDLANLVNQAALVASKRGNEVVTPDDFKEAYKKLLKPQEAGSGATGAVSTAGRTSSRARMYLPSQVKVNFANVAGAQEAKEELQDTVDFLKNPKKYQALGARLPRGVLLVGDPGNGKTLLAKAVAGEANVPFFSASGSEFVEEFVGVGAARVRDLFAQARRHAPCIVFIDEIDAIGSHRNVDRNSERDQTLNQLLTEMDGFDTNTSIIVMAATNRKDILDKALVRAGRFDREVYVPYPDVKAREEILRVHAKNTLIDEAVDLAKIARGTPGFTGADLANLLNDALIQAAKHGRSKAMIEDFEESRDKIILGKERKSVVMTRDELEMTAYHEAGHALVGLLMPDVTDPVYKVTIVPRGSALGVTHFLPERDKYSETKEQLLGSIMKSLGGRIAEELIFNKISTGAMSDFQHATDIARRIVCDYGMTLELGTLVYDQSKPGKYSEETAKKIDDTMRTIIENCYKQAYELLKNNKDMLEKLAKALLVKETLFAGEVYELLGIAPRTGHSIR